MDKKLVEEKAKLAINMINSIDEPYKKNAFQAVFSKLLDPTVADNHVTSKKSPQIKEVEKSGSIELKESRKILAKRCSIDIIQLDDIFDFRNDSVNILVLPETASPEKQADVLKCIMAGYQIVFDKIWIQAIKLGGDMKKIRMHDSHMARVFTKDERSFRKQGVGKSTEYKLTRYGLNSAFRIIKNLAEEAQDENKD